jgi:hypothetical protein
MAAKVQVDQVINSRSVVVEISDAHRLLLLT